MLAAVLLYMCIKGSTREKGGSSKMKMLIEIVDHVKKDIQNDCV